MRRTVSKCSGTMSSSDTRMPNSDSRNDTTSMMPVESIRPESSRDVSAAIVAPPAFSYIFSMQPAIFSSVLMRKAPSWFGPWQRSRRLLRPWARRAGYRPRLSAMISF